MSNELMTAIEIPMGALSVPQMIERRKAFLEFVKSCMNEGEDYGVIEGTQTKTLYKSGAEKMLTLYGFTSRMILTEKAEVWNQESPFFKYDYTCRIIWPRKMADGTIQEQTQAECDATCHSMEKKYGFRWLPYEQLTDNQKKKADDGELKSEGRDQDKPLFVLKNENQKLYEEIEADKSKWKITFRDSRKIDPKKGKPYSVEWVTIPAVKSYQVISDQVFDQVNTIKKMSQKRAFVGATILATGCSDLYTQDLEDMPDVATVRSPEVVSRDDKKAEKAKPVQPSDGESNEMQEKKNGALAASINICESVKELNALWKSLEMNVRASHAEEYNAKMKALRVQEA